MTAGLSEVDSFIAWLSVEQGRSSRTIEAYRRDLALYVDYLRSVEGEVATATSSQIDGFVAHLRQQGRAPKSVARHLAAVRMMHRFLVAEGMRSDNPTTLTEGVRIPKGLPKALSVDDVNRLLESVSGVDSGHS